MRKYTARAFWFSVLATLLPLNEATAYTTYCSHEAATTHKYGPKFQAIVWVPRNDGEYFRTLIEQHFERENYFVSTVSASNSRRPQETYVWDQLPQSESFDVSFTITTRSNLDFAFVELSTFSFECGATEDWEPHWRKFEVFLKESEFNKFISRRPWFPPTYHTVSY